MIIWFRFWPYFLSTPPNDVLSEIADLSQTSRKRGEIESNFFNTPIYGRAQIESLDISSGYWHDDSIWALQ